MSNSKESNPMEAAILHTQENGPKIPPRRIKEAAVAAEAKKALEAAGFEFRPIAWRGRKGCPDAMVLRPGGPSFFVEFKAPKGVKPRAEQAAAADYLRKMGHATYLCRDAGDIQEILRQEKAGPPTPAEMERAALAEKLKHRRARGPDPWAQKNE